jgi:hypothetical protein
VRTTTPIDNSVRANNGGSVLKPTGGREINTTGRTTRGTARTTRGTVRRTLAKIQPVRVVPIRRTTRKRNKRVA